MMKILLLTNILPPYRVPLYNLLSKWYEKEGYRLKIAFLAENEENRAWRVRRDELRVDAVVLPGWHKLLWRNEFPIHLNRRVWRFLSKENPDVVIAGGYSMIAYWIALAYCKCFSKPIILWTGTTKNSVKNRDPLRQILRTFFLKHVDAYITYGKKASEYLQELGVKPEVIFTGCNTGDVAFFKKVTAEYRQSEEFQNRRGKWSYPIILYVGQFIPRKGILQLIEALSSMRDQEWRLLLVGSGPMREKIEAAVKSKRLDNHVYLVGFQEKEELVKYYAVADIFVLPSLQEPFGIVVSEALASGLFVVASEQAGASWDLIEEGKNGVIVDPANIAQLREGIQEAIQCIKDPLYRRELVAQSIDSLGPGRYARAFLEAVKYVLKK